MARNTCNVARYACFVVVAFLALGCGRSEQEEAERAERKRIDCLEKICPGDNVPQHDSARDVVLKLKGRWYVGPQRYFSSGKNGAAFYWPSRKSIRPEALGVSPAVPQSADDEIVEIFLRSTSLPAAPYGYALIELAEKNNWITARKTLRPGLEQIQMKHAIGPNGHYLDNHTYYVATGLKGPDGLPPIGTCNHDDPRNGGGTGLMWRDGIWAGTRMNQRLCADLPEIYQELVHVLSLLREIE